MRTPWGTADYTQQLAPGVTVVGTPRHGGIHLSRERAATMPAHLRAYADRWAHGIRYSGEWWEEDVAAWAVIAHLGHEWGEDDERLAHARTMIERYITKD